MILHLVAVSKASTTKHIQKTLNIYQRQRENEFFALPQNEEAFWWLEWPGVYGRSVAEACLPKGKIYKSILEFCELLFLSKSSILSNSIIYLFDLSSCINTLHDSSAFTDSKPRSPMALELRLQSPKRKGTLVWWVVGVALALGCVCVCVFLRR